MKSSSSPGTKPRFGRLSLLSQRDLNSSTNANHKLIIEGGVRSLAMCANKIDKRRPGGAPLYLEGLFKLLLNFD